MNKTENYILKSRTQWEGHFGMLVLVSISTLLLFSEYLYLAVIPIVPMYYIVKKTPISWGFSSNAFELQYLLKKKKHPYSEIQKVNLLLPNARYGNVIKFTMNNSQTFSIDYQDKYWTQDLCNVLFHRGIKVINEDFTWLILENNCYSVKNAYPRNNKQIKRLDVINKEYL